MKHFYTVCLFFLFPFFVNAQWEHINCPVGTGDGIMNLKAYGNYVFAGVDGLGVEVSSDNGTSWNPSNLGVTTNYITAFTVKGSDIYTGSDAGIFRSGNNGGSWTEVNNGLTMTFISCLSNNGTSIYAGAGFGQIFRSDNNGGLWTEVSNGLPTTMSSMTITFTYKDGNVFAGMTGEGVYKSTNNGLNWTVSNNGMIDPIINSLLTSGNKILAATEDGLYVSTDDGGNWNIVSLGFPYITTYSLAKNGTHLYLGATKGVFLSNDNGVTWDSINTGFTKHNIELLAMNDNYLYALELETGIWRRPLSQIIGREEITQSDNWSIFPNPASDNITVETSETFQKSIVSVFNMNGQQLIHQPVTSPQTEFDISMLTKGVYVIKLSNEDGNVVRKFVKE
jgi:photosystem II stability/assembly factor-like uncharacterized protein